MGETIRKTILPEKEYFDMKWRRYSILKRAPDVETGLLGLNLGSGTH